MIKKNISVFLAVVIMFLLCSCSFSTNNWQKIKVRNNIILKLPNEFSYYTENDYGYITLSGEIVMVETKGETDPLAPEEHETKYSSIKKDKNKIFENSKNIASYRNINYSNLSVFGTLIHINSDVILEHRYFSVENTETTEFLAFIVVANEEIISNKTIEKIAKSMYFID